MTECTVIYTVDALYLSTVCTYADGRSAWRQRFETELEVLIAAYGKSTAQIKAIDTEEAVDYQLMLEKARCLGAASVGEFYKEFCEHEPATRKTKKQRLGWMIGTLRGWSAAPS